MSDDIGAVVSALSVVLAVLGAACVGAALIALGSFSAWAVVFVAAAWACFECYVSLQAS
jgi:hypothetical protein